jgi:hypothetical protein
MTMEVDGLIVEEVSRSRSHVVSSCTPDGSKNAIVAIVHVI